MGWLDEAEQSCEAGECVLSLDALISVGTKHLVVLEKFEACIAKNPLGLKPSVPVAPLRQWIGRWRAAAAEAETLGLGRDISYKYWQKNIALPETVVLVQKWFDTAEKVANSNAMDPPRLRKLIKDANHRVASLECHVSRASL